MHEFRNDSVWEAIREGFSISTDKTRLDLETIHNFLKTSYWAKNIPLAVVQKSIQHSLCFGVYESSQQIGFARVISDYATMAYLADVFILEAYRGQGLSKWLMECIMQHPQLQDLRRFFLATRDAHGLYAKFGFRALQAPERLMEILNLDPYNR
jgi:N-acetylglutamate synthase-like GNAT family acetyltransferase